MVGPAISRARSAPCRSADSIVVGVRPQLPVALANRGKGVGNRLAHALLERAIALTLELALDLLGLHAAGNGVDLDQVRDAGLVGPRAISVPESVCARFTFLTIASGSSSM